MSEHHASIDWNQLHGRLPIPMTNDYLFRALMQRNNHVLKALVCSLLHLDENTVSQVVIQNPIILGEYIEDKDFVLDILVLLDMRLSICLEMQVINEGNWPERSLSYLCRTFDSLREGRNYSQVLPAVQIGILDYTLFPESPELYATYRLMNEKTHKIYSDKLRLSVLDLKHIELATEEDRTYQIDHWARLFKSTTWEELKGLAENHTAISEAAETVYTLSEDKLIRMRCEAREDYYRRAGWKDEKIEELSATVKEQNSTIEEQNLTIEQQAALIRQLQQKLVEAGRSDKPST